MKLALILISIVSGYHVVLFKTNSIISEAIKSNLGKLQTSVIFTQTESFKDLEALRKEETDLIIISSENEIEELKAKTLTEELGIPALHLTSGDSSTPTFYVKLGTKMRILIIGKFLADLSISRFAVTWTYYPDNLKIVKGLKELFSSNFQQIVVTSEALVDELASLMIKVFKVEGFQNFLFLGHETICSSVQQGFNRSRLNVEGNLGIFLDECIYQVKDEGALFLVESGLEYVKTKDEYLIKQLQPFLSVFNQSHLTSVQINEKLLQASIKNYSIMNIKNSSLVKVGEINCNQTSITETLQFYSGVTNRSDYPSPRITISANTGTFNPNASPVFHNKKYHEGTYFAVEKINKDKKVFPNHFFYLYDKVDCGVSVFDYNYSKSCMLRHIPRMGNCYIPTVTFINANLLDQLSTLHINIPFIAGILSAAPLSNKQRFPTFIRIVSPVSLFSRAWSNLINIYGWKKIVMHYTNDSFGIASFETLNRSALSQGYEIINDEKYRMINNILSNDSIPQYYEHMKNTISLGCNIIFLGMGDPSAFFWLEGMYDLGVRRGDFVFIFFTTTGLDAFQQPTGNSKKRQELMHGSFVVYNAAWVGLTGNQVKHEFLLTRNNSWCRSYNVDAVFTAAKTIEFLMMGGKSFEDHEIFNNAMRLIRFEGATGVISFDSSSNDRNIFYFNLFNFYQDSQGSWHEDETALISPLGSVYFQTIKDSVWPGGKLPTDMKKNFKNCGFREEVIQNSTQAKKIKLLVNILVVFIVLLCLGVALKRTGFQKFEEITEKTSAVFNDYLVIGLIVVESVQVLSIGPDFQSFNKPFNDLCLLVSLNFLQVAYWKVFIACLVLTFCWASLFLIGFKKFYFGFKSLRQQLEPIKPLTIPIMTGYLYLPVLIGLFSVLLCDNSTGSDLSDSYLNYDCTFQCWKMPHSLLAFIVCIEITCFVPLATVTRNSWQIESSSLNIKASSLFLTVEKLKVLVMVVLNNLLKNDYPTVHSFLFLLMDVLVLALVMFLKKPFNYDRANLWVKTLKFCVIWNVIICILSQQSNLQVLVLVSFQLIGWFIIVAFSFRQQAKLPRNLLITIKGPEIKNLVLFSFGRKNAAQGLWVKKESKLDVDLRSQEESKSG